MRVAVFIHRLVLLLEPYKISSLTWLTGKPLEGAVACKPFSFSCSCNGCIGSTKVYNHSVIHTCMHMGCCDCYTLVDPLHCGGFTGLSGACGACVTTL